MLHAFLVRAATFQRFISSMKMDHIKRCYMFWKRQTMFKPSDKNLFLCLVIIVVVVVVVQHWRQNSSSRRHHRVDHVHMKSHSENRDKKQHSKWLIALSYTGDDVINIPGWRVLLLDNNTLSSSACRVPWCISLNSTDPHLSADTVDGDLFNKAYLYAISNGAKHMCVIRHLNTCGLEIVKRIFHDMSQTGLVVMRNKTIFDPHAIVHSSRNATMSSLTEFYIGEDIKPLVMSVFNPLNLREECNPAVLMEPLKQHPPIFLPLNTYTFLSPHVMAFHYEAFWALPLWTVQNGGFIMQRVLSYLNGRVRIYPSSVQSHSTGFNTFSSERLVAFLHSWSCVGNLHVLECVSDLVKRLEEHELLTSGEAHFVDEWLVQLQANQYIIPKRIQERTVDFKKTTTFGIISTPVTSISLTDTYHKRLKAICPQTDIQIPDTPINDVALVISFNEPSFYANIPLLEAMYRPYFNNIIFCGPNIKEFTSHVQNTTSGYFIYMELLKRGWYYMYECLIEAMKLNVDVKGFLQIGDDTLVNPWNIYNLPRDKIWLHTGVRRENISDEELTPNWIWWKDGKPAMLAVIDEIRNMSLVNSTRSFANLFLHNYGNNSNNFTTLTIQGCDFMYVPAFFKENFTLVANLMLKHDVMVEIGFANAAYGLRMLKDILFVKDGSLWYHRERYIDLYSTRDVFIQPFKLRHEISGERARAFFCSTYLNATART